MGAEAVSPGAGGGRWLGVVLPGWVVALLGALGALGVFYAGVPAAGAGSRWVSWGPVSSCADEDGSADGGSVAGGGGGGEAGGGVGVSAGGVGDAGAPVGGPAGTPGGALCPGCTGASGPALPPPRADRADADADSPGFGFPACPRLPSATAPPYPAPPSPDTPGPAPAPSPPRCPAECDGLAFPASSPTFTQPAAAATAITVTARRTGTFKGRTAATSGGK